MAPKPKGAASADKDPMSPKGKARASPLGGAGAAMMGGGTSPKGPPPSTGVNGKASGLPMVNGNGPAKGDANGAPTNGAGTAPLGKAGSRAVGGNASARSNTSANAKGDEPKSPGKAPVAAQGKAAPVSEPAKAEPAKEKTAAPAPAAAAPPAVSGLELEPEAVLKFHSAVRWAKPWAEIEASAEGADIKMMCSEKDPKNGNTAVHIAAQNGHMDILVQMIKAGAPLNVNNGKGQTPLHMCVEYDFYFVSRMLIDAGADKELVNEDGHKAIAGIEGTKIDGEAWDNPVTILRAATTAEEFKVAFSFLEEALKTPEIVSKEKLIAVGLNKKKSPITQACWDHKTFMSLAAKF